MIGKLYPKFFLLAGCVTGLLAVVLGAFGAHGLEKIVEPKILETYQTGVQYQFYHSFALITAGMFAHFWPETKHFNAAGISFLIGIIIFSGSLYLYTLTGNKVFGMITPLGGLSFIFGWGLLIIALWKSKI
ncbi:MAG: DUF423 domain-containing protein [Thiotrichaceae bacterium]